VVSKKPVTCAPDDSVQAAVGMMKEALVRRLPVVGFAGVLLGIVSMNDILLTSAGTRPSAARTSSRHCRRFVPISIRPACHCCLTTEGHIR
jgi:CBS domain-containing protein